MNTKYIKLLTIFGFAVAVFALLTVQNKMTVVRANADDETKTLYTQKCQMCHKPKAEQFYNPELPLEEQIKAILEGKQGEKIKMAGFRDKGIDDAKAKALAEYMIGLRKENAPATNTNTNTTR